MNHKQENEGRKMCNLLVQFRAFVISYAKLQDHCYWKKSIENIPNFQAEMCKYHSQEDLICSLCPSLLPLRPP